MLWLLRQADACRRGITRHPRFVEISGATIKPEAATFPLARGAVTAYNAVPTGQGAMSGPAPYPCTPLCLVQGRFPRAQLSFPPLPGLARHSPAPLVFALHRIPGTFPRRPRGRRERSSPGPVHHGDGPEAVFRRGRSA